MALEKRGGYLMQETKLKKEGKMKGSIEKEEQKAEEHEKEEAEKPMERIRKPEKPSIIPEIIGKEPYKPEIEVEKKESIEEILKDIEDRKRRGLDTHYYPDRQFYLDYEADLKKLEKLGYPHVDDLRKELIEKTEENIKRDKERYLKVRDLIQKHWKEKNENNLTKLYCLWMWLCHLKSDDAIKNLKAKFDKKEEEAEKIYEDFLTDLDSCGIKDTGTFVYTGGAVHVNAYKLTLAGEAIEGLLKEESGFDSFVEEVKKESERIEAKGVIEKHVAAVEDKKPEKLEIPNFFELLLGKGFGRISGGKPVCIIVEKTKGKLEELIAVLCRDIYREKVGGKPTPIYRNTIENLKREWNSLVERKIIIIENIDVEESREELFEMLKGFFSQDIGFLILVTSEPLKLEDEIRNVEPSANIVRIGLPPEIEKKKEEILRTIRGKKLTMSLDATGSVSIEEIRGFGEEFKTSVEIFDNELMKYLDYEKAPWDLKQNRDKLVACSPADYEKKASDEHSAMKAFVWLYEWIRHDKRKIPDLETEDKGTDVRIDGNNYEIETLFGIGDVASKLTEKMKKYNKNEKVYFVLRNLDILRNLPILSTFRTNWRKARYEVEFFGLDLDKEELVPLDEFVKLEGKVHKMFR